VTRKLSVMLRFVRRFTALGGVLCALCWYRGRCVARGVQAVLRLLRAMSRRSAANYAVRRVLCVGVPRELSLGHQLRAAGYSDLGIVS
jgi:hypothetical protein